MLNNIIYNSFIIFIILMSFVFLFSNTFNISYANVISEAFYASRVIDSSGSSDIHDSFWHVGSGQFKIINMMGIVDSPQFRAMEIHPVNAKENYTAQVYFNYTDYDGSEATDSISFYYNYHDTYNKYSVGLRADGYSEIKEKNENKYSENYNPVLIFGNGATDNELKVNENGDEDSKIPKNRWIGLKIDIIQGKNFNTVKMYVNKGNGWNYVTQWTDKEDVMNGGYVGLRTDGYNVQFKDFKVEKSI